jgi:hypothetical protein
LTWKAPTACVLSNKTIGFPHNLTKVNKFFKVPVFSHCIFAARYLMALPILPGYQLAYGQ